MNESIYFSVRENTPKYQNNGERNLSALQMFILVDSVGFEPLRSQKE